MNLAEKVTGTAPPQGAALHTTQAADQSPLQQDLPGGGGRGCFHDSGALRRLGGRSSPTPMYLELLLKWAETHVFYIPLPPPTHTHNHQHGCFWAAWLLSQAEVRSRETSECRGGRAFPPRSGVPADRCGAGPWTAGRRGPGREPLCRQERQQRGLVSGAVTVKASVHDTWQ